MFKDELSALRTNILDSILSAETRLASIIAIDLLDFILKENKSHDIAIATLIFARHLGADMNDVRMVKLPEIGCAVGDVDVE